MLPERRAGSFGSTSSVDSLDEFLHDFEVVRCEPATGPGQPQRGANSLLRGVMGRPPRPQLRLSSHPYLQARRAALVDDGADGAAGRAAGQGYDRLSLSAVPDADDEAAARSMQMTAHLMRDAHLQGSGHAAGACQEASPWHQSAFVAHPLHQQGRMEAMQSGAASDIFAASNAVLQPPLGTSDKALTACDPIESPVSSATLAARTLEEAFSAASHEDSSLEEIRPSDQANASRPDRPTSPVPPAAPRPALKQVLQAVGPSQAPATSTTARPQPVLASTPGSSTSLAAAALGSAGRGTVFVNPLGVAAGGKGQGAGYGADMAYGPRDPLAGSLGAPNLRKRDFESELLDRLLNSNAGQYKQGMGYSNRAAALGLGPAPPRALGLARLLLVMGLFALMGLALFVFMSGRIQARSVLRPQELYVGLPPPQIAASVEPSDAHSDPSSATEAREEHHRFEHGEHHHAADQRPVLPHRNGSSGHHHGEGSRQEGHHEGHAHGEGLPEEHHRGPPGLRLLLVHAIEAEVPDEPRGAVGIRSMAARFSKGLDSMI